MDVSIQIIHSTMDEIKLSLQALTGAVPALAQSNQPRLAGQLNLHTGGGFGMSPFPTDVLSRWPWVDPAVVQEVADNTFDIYRLPKLLRPDQIRQKNIPANDDFTLVFGSDGTPIRSSKTDPQTKLEITLPSFSAFMAAWAVYMSIRVAYALEFGSDLAAWTERISFYVSIARYPWPAILRYVVDYYQTHHRHPADQWFSTDPKLVSNNLSHTRQTPTAAYSSAAAKGKTMRSTLATRIGSIADQICHNWNKDSGCTMREATGRECVRRHVCLKCESSSHKATQCPGGTAKRS